MWAFGGDEEEHRKAAAWVLPIRLVNPKDTKSVMYSGIELRGFANGAGGAVKKLMREKCVSW